MKSIVLKRISTNDDGTYGVLIDGTEPFALTLENPWYNNKKEISCIPAGSYVCKRIQSPMFGNTFEITNVPNRTHILFHKGNTKENTLGCILVGEQFGYLNNKMAVLSSKSGYTEFMEKLKDINDFQIIIFWS